MLRLAVTPIIRAVRTLGVGCSEPRRCCSSQPRAPPPWSGRNRPSRWSRLCLGLPSQRQNLHRNLSRRGYTVSISSREFTGPASGRTAQPAQPAKTPSDKPPTAIHQGITHTREQLADTVEALANKMDLPVRVKDKVQQTKDAVQAKVDEVRQHLHKSTETLQDKAVEMKSLSNQALERPPIRTTGGERSCLPSACRAPCSDWSKPRSIGAEQPGSARSLEHGRATKSTKEHSMGIGDKISNKVEEFKGQGQGSRRQGYRQRAPRSQGQGQPGQGQRQAGRREGQGRLPELNPASAARPDGPTPIRPAGHPPRCRHPVSSLTSSAGSLVSSWAAAQAFIAWHRRRGVSARHHRGRTRNRGVPEVLAGAVSNGLSNNCGPRGTAAPNSQQQELRSAW